MAAVERRLSTGSENYEEDNLDPRVQVELEKLNKFSIEINTLELELDEARSCFRQTLMDSSHKLNALSKKLGSCIDKARPYYEARMKSKEYQTETQKAALRFERACSQQAAAKEMVTLAEEGFFKKGQPFDPAWQEMLNHATMKVNEAEQERLESELEHQQTAATFSEAEQKVKQLQKELKRVITKSSVSTRRSLLQLNNLANQHRVQLLPYFEMKAKFNQFMEEQKKKVSGLESGVTESKASYSQALRNLEKISDDIHQQRRESKARRELGCRGSGVGAESPSPPPQMEMQSRLQYTCAVAHIPGNRKHGFGQQLTVSSPPDLRNKKSRSLPRDMEGHFSAEVRRELEDEEYMKLPNRLETPEGLVCQAEKDLMPSFKTLPNTYSPRGKIVARSGNVISEENKSQKSKEKSQSESSSLSEVDSLPEASASNNSAEKRNSGPQSPVPILQLSPSETETRTLDYFSDADSECQRTNAEIMESLRQVKSIAKGFLQPRKSVDSLDDGSDVESVSESLSSAAMLDDEQVESLMIDTGEFATVLVEKPVPSRADSLPSRLSYLDEYLPIKVNWVNSDSSHQDNELSSQDEGSDSSHILSPNDVVPQQSLHNLTVTKSEDVLDDKHDKVSADSAERSRSDASLVGVPPEVHASVTDDQVTQEPASVNDTDIKVHVCDESSTTCLRGNTAAAQNQNSQSPDQLVEHCTRL